MGVLLDLFKWILSIHRERALDKRASTVDLAAEIDRLADLLDHVLKASTPGGSLNLELLPSLEAAHRRVWSRWVTILGTSGYASQDPDVQKEVDRCIKIAHAAPGAYVEEVLLVQFCVAEKKIPIDLRERFSTAIDNLRDLSTKMRLNR
ncbi:hypothetical protein D3C84_381930 [compost metagenome]